MPPEILTVMTPEMRDFGPEPKIFYDTVRSTNFDPWEPWYPCGCPKKLADQHEDYCWMSWLPYPMWMREDTTEVPVITVATESSEESDVDSDDTTLLGVVEPLDEDETTYFERHHDEPTFDVDERDEALRDALREDAEMDVLMSQEDSRGDEDETTED